MKIAFFAGYSKSILQFNSELISEMTKKGHEVVCIGPEDEYRQEFEKLGAEFINIKFNRHSINPFKGLGIINELEKLFKEQRFDLYYGFTAMPVTYGVIAAKKAGIKEIYAAITGAGKIVQTRPGILNKFIRIVLTLMYKYSLRNCKKVFFLNEDNINYFIKHKIVKKEQCVKTGGSGVNTTKYTPKPLPDKECFLFVGALMRFKGIIEYMKAARLVKKEYPYAEFHIVGAIDDRVSSITQSELDEYINDESVIYHGYQKDVKPFLESCRYFVLPSYSEGVPTCVLEAMATKRPIITTLAPGCRETVINGKNGFLVPVADVDALADKMKYMIEHPEETEKMAEASLVKVKQEFDVTKVNEVMMRVMQLM